jgi:CubicO group peptidase (beta-lactamase class C family)
MSLAELHALVEEGRTNGYYPGAAYRVLRYPDQVLAEGVVGLAQVGPDVPVTLGTIWDMASLTKPIATATSVLILAEAGKLHLEEEVGAFLPEGSPALTGITLRHLMTHVSGLRPYERFPAGTPRAEVLRRIRCSERQRPPGTGYTYSDLGYILLGDVVESVTGKTEAEFAKERIYTPLGMRDAGYRPDESLKPRMALTRDPDLGVLSGVVHDPLSRMMGGISGHAGLFATLDDVTRFATMILGNGEAFGKRILGPAAVALMRKNHNPAGINGHTLGWFTRPNGYLPTGDFLPDDTFGHTGFTGTSLLLSPSLGLAAILLTNRVLYDKDATPFLRFRRVFHNAVAALSGRM